MALQCENPKVVPKAIDFLIKVYYSLDSDLDEKKLDAQDSLISECMRILRESKDEHTIVRVIEIIKNIIQETEKKGTGDVKPHNALLKGELLENITIKNKTSHKGKNLLIKIYSNATVWEFKKEVSKLLGLAPKYLKIEIGQNKVVKDTDNGKTLAQLGLQSNDFVSAYKSQVEEEIPNAPLIGSDGKLTEKAKQIFNEWFDMYSDSTDGMTKDTCSLFIKGCTGEQPAPNDDRILGLFKTYDSN
jgi:ubiquitin carboxyl-terminal hydrolase 9/24